MSQYRSCPLRAAAAHRAITLAGSSVRSAAVIASAATGSLMAGFSSSANIAAFPPVLA
jgi:hypothetical protein